MEMSNLNKLTISLTLLAAAVALSTVQAAGISSYAGPNGTECFLPDGTYCIGFEPLPSSGGVGGGGRWGIGIIQIAVLPKA